MIHYTVEHDYYPDFRLDTGTKHIHIETKGYFQDRAECSKYLWIKKALCDDEELLFVFEKPEKAMHFQRKRKCGTKMSHAEWCERNGFPYCSEAELPQYIIDNWGD